MLLADALAWELAGDLEDVACFWETVPVARELACSIFRELACRSPSNWLSNGAALVARELACRSLSNWLSKGAAPVARELPVDLEATGLSR